MADDLLDEEEISRAIRGLRAQREKDSGEGVLQAMWMISEALLLQTLATVRATNATLELLDEARAAQEAPEH